MFLESRVQMYLCKFIFIAHVLKMVNQSVCFVCIGVVCLSVLVVYKRSLYGGLRDGQARGKERQGDGERRGMEKQLVSCRVSGVVVISMAVVVVVMRVVDITMKVVVVARRLMPLSLWVVKVELTSWR